MSRKCFLTCHYGFDSTQIRVFSLSSTTAHGSGVQDKLVCTGRKTIIILRRIKIITFHKYFNI